MGALHGLRGVRTVSSTRATLVERHHDVCANATLDVHDVFGRKEQFAAVNVAGELHSFVGHLTQIGEREHLKSTGVGQDRMIPPLEAMESTGAEEDIRTRAEIEVVGVAKDDLSMDIILQFVAMNTFDRTVRTDGHEDGR